MAAYAEEHAADDTADALMRTGSLAGLLYEDGAVVRRDAEGRVHVTETGDMSARSGAGIGAVVGGIIGILAGPSGMVIGAGAGAALGGLAAHADTGFDQHSLETLGAALPAGTSALVVTTDQTFVESVRDRHAQADRVVMAAQIAAVISDHLRAGHDVLLAMDVTVDGVVASRIVSAPDQLAVFNITHTRTDHPGANPAAQ